MLLLHDDIAIDELDPDPMRTRRRRGLVLALVSFDLLVALVAIPLVVPAKVLEAAWLGAALAQIVTAIASAVDLRAARDGDRARAQALCTWASGAAVVLAIIGAIALAVAPFAFWLVASVPFCGVCGS